MERSATVYSPERPLKGALVIPGSKSISNRILLIRALAGSSATIANLSDSDDTGIMQKALGRPINEGSTITVDAGHAGTSYRFLTAYFAIMPGIQIMTGSQRMKERPVGVLVEALQSIGARIEYLEKEGFPPLKIFPFEKQTGREVRIDGSISSQFASALCMIGPVLPMGLNLKIDKNPVSRGYLELTLSLMKQMGAICHSEDRMIRMGSGGYQMNDFEVEPDWSSAAYIYALASAVPDSEITLKGFRDSPLQPDSVIVVIARDFGVQTHFVTDGITLRSGFEKRVKLEMDFLRTPDLAQTVALMAAVNDIELSLGGLQTLRIKETDRISALASELKKTGISLKESELNKGQYYLEGRLTAPGKSIQTYNDHRMAMSFATVGMRYPVRILNPECVSKSYPSFWEDLEKLGVPITYQ